MRNGPARLSLGSLEQGILLLLERVESEILPTGDPIMPEG